MNISLYRIVPRLEFFNGQWRAVLFFPDHPVSRIDLVRCYTAEEGHGEASKSHYNGTLPANKEARQLAEVYLKSTPGAVVRTRINKKGRR